MIYKSFFLVFFVGLGFSLSAQQNEKDANGKRHGLWTKNYDNGKMRYQGTFNHGVPVDTFKHYFDDGQLRTLNIYRGKTGNCLSLQYGEKKILAAKGVYVNQKKDSVWTYFNRAGQVIARETYRKDVKTGKAYKYFTSGKIAEVVTFENGIENGPFERFYESGKPMARGIYQDGKLHGEALYFHSNGKPRLKGSYTRGLMHGPWYHFGDNLKLTKKEIYRYGVLQEKEKNKEEGQNPPPK